MISHGFSGARRFRVSRSGFDLGFSRRNRSGAAAGVCRASAGAGNENENESSTGPNESTGPSESSPSLRDAFVRGSARYYSNLVNASKFELGFDIGNAVEKVKAQIENGKDVVANAVGSGKQRAKELRAEVEEARTQSQEAAAEAQAKYWPQFVEWNRWELWKVSAIKISLNPKTLGQIQNSKI